MNDFGPTHKVSISSTRTQICKYKLVCSKHYRPPPPGTDRVRETKADSLRIYTITIGMRCHLREYYIVDIR